MNTVSFFIAIAYTAMFSICFCTRSYIWFPLQLVYKSQCSSPLSLSPFRSIFRYPAGMLSNFVFWLFCKCPSRKHMPLWDILTAAESCSALTLHWIICKPQVIVHFKKLFKKPTKIQTNPEQVCRAEGISRNTKLKYWPKGLCAIIGSESHALLFLSSFVTCRVSV